VTCAGFPLYRFAADLKPGQTSGEGVEKIWFALNPSGKIVKPTG
jgi:predicted lipoprotein with Yx(FWY)xxD motif